jgi:hypothetical protein
MKITTLRRWVLGWRRQSSSLVGVVLIISSDALQGAPAYCVRIKQLLQSYAERAVLLDVIGYVGLASDCCHILAQRLVSLIGAVACCAVLCVQANKHFDKEAAVKEAENVVKAKQVTYNKDDFFDMMSCETLDKMGQGDGMQNRRTMQVSNLVTL